jgi:diguanylate cyclase (GGDEF)-like protein
MLALAPAAAAAATAYAARAVPRGLRGPWYVLAASGVLAIPTVLHPHGTAGTSLEWLYVLFGVAAVVVFGVGLGWILHLRDRLRFLDVTLDAALVLAAAIVVLLHFSPAARLAVMNPTSSTTVAVVGALAAAAAIGSTLLFAMVLLVVRRAPQSRVLAISFAVATAGLAAALVPVGFGLDVCCHDSGLGRSGFVLGWAGVAVAGWAGGRRGRPAFRSVGSNPAHSRLRMVVAPGVALVMGVIVAGWRGNPELAPATAVAFGALAALLALRVTQLLFTTHTLSAERAELHQSRALIELSHALSATTDLQETLDLITQWAVKLLDGRGAAIQLVTADGVMLEFRSIRRLPNELLKLRLPVEGSFAGWVVQHSRPRVTADPHADIVSNEKLRYIGNSPIAAAPLRYREETMGALLCIGRNPFDATDIELLRALADHAAVAIQNARLFQQVHHLSMTDPLTTLPNRRQLERDLAREFAAAQRGRKLTLVLFDLNGFKQYNDRYGHLAGDEALRLFGSALAAETRAMNIAARYGGDEFLSVLADAGRAETEIFIGRLRQRFPGPHATQQERELGFSAGIAEFVPGMTVPAQLIAAADVALYEEKMRRKQARLPQSA